MYRPLAYVVDDAEILHETIRIRRFATIAAAIDGCVQFAYAPVVLNTGEGQPTTIRFHLARGNPLASVGGAAIRMSFLGPDAYISPDWYETPALVPTWNYVAVEATGIAREIDAIALRRLLVDLSAVEESRLAPKPAWTLDKVPEDRLEMFLHVIRGFEMPIETLEGKFKLSQDKTATDFAGAVAGLDARGDAASVAVANAMRGMQKRRE